MRTALLVLAAALAAGCPKPRASAVIQPGIAPFDPAASDPKALALADAGLAALGGHDAWEKLQELSFTAKLTLDGQLKSWTIHRWDRWNGRHNFQAVDMSTLTGKPDDIKASEVRYYLYDTQRKPYFTYDGKEGMRADADKRAAEARARLHEEGFLITMTYRMRDPGVKVTIGAPLKVDGACDACETVQLAFDPAVTKATWFVSYDPTSKLPVAIAQDVPGRGLIGYKIESWHDAGGLKWPGKLQNIGMAGEVWEFSDVAVAEPDDYTYMRSVAE